MKCNNMSTKCEWWLSGGCDGETQWQGYKLVNCSKLVGPEMFRNITFASLQVWQLRFAWLSVVIPIISYLCWLWCENYWNYVVLKMWNTTQIKKHGWQQSFSWSSLVHKINNLLFVDKYAIHLRDILFLRNTKFLYYPPNTRAWCLPWGVDKARGLEICWLLFLCVFRKTSLPHTTFPALMTGMMTVQVAGRKRKVNMTMNRFCQAHAAAYKLERSFFYVHSTGRCDEQNIWTWNSHCSIRNTRLQTKQLSITDFFGKNVICMQLLM